MLDYTSIVKILLSNIICSGQRAMNFHYRGLAESSSNILQVMNYVTC